jgi:hypothetical protein
VTLIFYLWTYRNIFDILNKKTNSGTLVRKRTIPTEGPKLMPTSADRWCCVVSAMKTKAVNFCILDRSRYFPFKFFLSYPHEAEWTPFQTHYFSENLVAPGIEPGTSGSVAWNSDH